MTTTSRKIAAAVGAIALITAVTACSSSSGGDAKTLAYLPGVAGDNFYISVECAAQDEAEKLGYQLDVQAPAKWDVTLQRPILDSAIANNPDAIIVTPTDSSALQASLDQAKAAGATIVLSDTTTEDPSVAVASVTADNKEVGAKAFEAIQQAHPEGGKVLIINSTPGISTGDDRAAGFTEAVEAAEGFELLGQQFAGDDTAKAAQLTAAALQKDPDLIGIFGTSGNETAGASTGVLQAGLKGEVTVVGVDAYPAQVEALRSGDVQALVAQDVDSLGRESVRQAVAALEGEDVTTEVLVGSTILTAETLDTPEGAAAVYKTDCGS